MRAFRRFLGQLNGLPFAGKLAPLLVAVGAGLHAAHIIVSSIVTARCARSKSIHFAMSVVSMLACVVYLVMRRRYRIDVVGAFVAPLALTRALLASRFVSGDRACREVQEHRSCPCTSR